MSVVRQLPCIVLAFLAAVACSREHPLQPHSGGKPSEVLIVGDRDSLITRWLCHPVSGLPQGEPSFDISHVTTEGYGASLRMARVIVIPDIDASQHNAIRLHYERDLYAQPQLIVTIESPSWGTLRESSAQVGRKLRQLLLRFESNCYIHEARKSRNTRMEELVARQLGATLFIPADLSSVKQGKNFVWLSDNGKSVQRNLCLYRLPAGTSAITGRDSVMAANLPGEHDGMVMHTVPGSTTEQTVTVGGHQVTVISGLWEMTGDAMGGPFVQHLLNDSISGGQIVGEAFVYAPGMKKRDLLRELEALLFTLRNQAN